MFVIGTAEIQFIAYLQLIRDRLISLNSIMINFNSDKKLTQNNRNYYGNNISDDILNTPINATYTNTPQDEKHRQQYWGKFIYSIANKCDIGLTTTHTIDPINVSNQMKAVLPKRNLKTTVSKEKGFEMFNKSWRLSAVREGQNVHRLNTNDENYYSQHTHNQRSDHTKMIIKAQNIYMKLERVSALINSSYGIPIMFILVIKFTTLTALLYFCCMIIIK